MEELEQAMELLADVAEELAFEDGLLNGALSQTVFNKLARASSLIERVYFMYKQSPPEPEELDFERNQYLSAEDAELDD